MYIGTTLDCGTKVVDIRIVSQDYIWEEMSGVLYTSEMNYKRENKDILNANKEPLLKRHCRGDDDCPITS